MPLCQKTISSTRHKIDRKGKKLFISTYYIWSLNDVRATEVVSLPKMVVAVATRAILRNRDEYTIFIKCVSDENKLQIFN